MSKCHLQKCQTPLVTPQVTHPSNIPDLKGSSNELSSTMKQGDNTLGIACPSISLSEPLPVYKLCLCVCNQGWVDLRGKFCICKGAVPNYCLAKVLWSGQTKHCTLSVAGWLAELSDIIWLLLLVISLDWMAGNCLHLGDIWSKSEKCCTLILMCSSNGPI